MEVYGDIKLAISTEDAANIQEAYKLLNNHNVLDVSLTLKTYCGHSYTLNVHDLSIKWENDDVA